MVNLEEKKFLFNFSTFQRKKEEFFSSFWWSLHTLRRHLPSSLLKNFEKRKILTKLFQLTFIFHQGFSTSGPLIGAFRTRFEIVVLGTWKRCIARRLKTVLKSVLQVIGYRWFSIMFFWSSSDVRLVKVLYLPWPDKNCCLKLSHSFTWQNSPKTKHPVMPNGPKSPKTNLKKT